MRAREARSRNYLYALRANRSLARPRSQGSVSEALYAGRDVFALSQTLSRNSRPPLNHHFSSNPLKLLSPLILALHESCSALYLHENLLS